MNELFKLYKVYLGQQVEKRQYFQNKLAIAKAKEGKSKVYVKIDRMQRTE